MAKCEEGYLCDICGGDVEHIFESDLYLRYVIGMIDPETLHTTKERHILCNKPLAQFIVHEKFPAVVDDSLFDKRQLDPAYVASREMLVTRGWLRLCELAQTEGLSLLEYPLPEVVEAMRSAAGRSS